MSPDPRSVCDVCGSDRTDVHWSESAGQHLCRRCYRGDVPGAPPLAEFDHTSVPVPAPDALVLPPPSAPLEVAEELLQARYQDAGTPTLRHWRGGWWRWRTTRWTEVAAATMRATAYEFTRHATYMAGDKPCRWDPNRRKVADVLDALAALAHLPDDVSMPTWLDGREYDGLLVAVENGLLDVGTRELHPHTPHFFNATSVPFDYDADAPTPRRWNKFLGELWGDDSKSVAALAQGFGYVISGRLDQHKILLLIGPTRAGKGVTSRILGALVGEQNVAGPTLSSLNGDFGLAPLLGKTLAVVSDARLNGKAAHVVVERLLSISTRTATSSPVRRCSAAICAPRWPGESRSSSSATEIVASGRTAASR